MTTRYRLEPDQGRFTVHAFATGMLSSLGHSPSFAVRGFAGEVRLDDGSPGRVTLDVAVRADSLVLTDRVSAPDRREIEDRMRREVLECAAFPEIRYEVGDVESSLTGPGRFRLQLRGQLSLHGVTRPHAVDAELRLFVDGLQLSGGFPLRLSDHRIKPVSALGGAIKLKDEVSVSFEHVGLPEGS